MSIYSGPETPTTGLVLSLDAANPKSYPGTGNTWFDVSGKGNHCVFTNLPTYDNGAFTFNGTSNEGTITNNTTLDFSQEQTIVMVLKHSFTTGRRNPWNQAYGGYGTWTHESGNNIGYYYGDSGTNSTPYTAWGSQTTTRNVWNIMCSVRNVTNIVWYMNASQSTFQTNSYGDLVPTSANITIGRGYAGFWEGQMALVYAYTKALTAQEVRQLFNALRSRFGI